MGAPSGQVKSGFSGMVSVRRLLEGQSRIGQLLADEASN